ncbi:MAG TPA: polysaccharide deacetylase family protein [Methylomirabilota bacterium]|nr:polysaccharide deacetylase family protein [Methylomirabilota bacterium]
MRNFFAALILAGLTSLLLQGCASVQPPAPGQQEKAAVAAQKQEIFESEDFIVAIAKPGDTTQSLAAKFLGAEDKSWMIEEYNEVSTLSPGQQVIIPKHFWNLSGVDPSGYQLVPILVYHNLGPQAKGRLLLGVKSFEEQMRYLKSQGYRVVSLKEFLEYTSLKKQLPRKSLVLSFDDGYRAFLQYAYPILKELGFTATLFVYTDYIGAGSNALSWADLKKLAAEGFDIEAHSKTHGNMRRTAGESANEYAKRLAVELNLPKELFLKNLGYSPQTLAYPYGSQDDVVVQRTKELGYVAAFTVRRQGNPSFVEPLKIHRSQIYSEMSLDDFIKNLNFFNQESLK